jgi:hypothetical protein
MPIAKMKEQAFQFAAIGSVLPVFDAVGTASWNFGGRSKGLASPPKILRRFARVPGHGAA